MQSAFLIFLKIPFGIDSVGICTQDLEKELPPSLIWANLFPTKVKKGYKMLETAFTRLKRKASYRLEEKNNLLFAMHDHTGPQPPRPITA